MTTYLLVIAVWGGYGSKMITFQEFNSRENCQYTVTELVKADLVKSAFCVAK